MQYNTLLAVATCAMFVVVVVVNYIATSETIGAVAFTNSQVADTHPVYGLPNGWAFAIWGIIFLFLGLYTIYQALPTNCWGGFECEVVAKIRVPALGMMCLNSVWNFLFGWEFYWMALLDIVLYDALLWTIIGRLAINYFAGIPSMSRWGSVRTKIFVATPFSIHAGWVTVATALNVQVNLLEEGWMPSPDFSVFCCWVAVAIGLYLTILRHADLPYTLVTLWALGGIVSNQSDGSTWGCASRICGACIEASPPICNRPSSAGAGHLPNGWGSIDCARWGVAATNVSGWGTAETVALNALDCGVTVIPKSEAVVYWSVGGMVFVACALVAGIVHTLCFMPLESLETANKSKLQVAHQALDAGMLETGSAPKTAAVMNGSH